MQTNIEMLKARLTMYYEATVQNTTGKLKVDKNNSTKTLTFPVLIVQQRSWNGLTVKETHQRQ